ncbi:MAG: 5'-nucleotidase C-terminal domain-containing protein [Gammaproteobacteria bacterium]
MKTTKMLTGICLALSTLAAQADTKTITFMHLNDLHGHLVPHKELIADGEGGTNVEERGGLARIATMVKQIRAENPNSLLMNVGDTYHGTVEAFYSMGNAVAGPLNALGVDIGVPGNWDFYYTPGITRMRYSRLPMDFFEIPMPLFDNPIPVKQPNFPNLGGNITDVTDFLPLGRDFLPATHSFTKDGVKISFIGITTDILEDMHPMLAQGFYILQGEKAYRNLINTHANRLRKNGADIVVVMSELGLQKDKRLADVIDSGLVDVFFSAHTHETTFEPIQSDSGAVLVEAGNDSYLGRMDITVEKTAESSEIVALNWNMLDVDSSVAEDAAMKALVDAERAPYLADDVFLLAPPFMIQSLTQPIDTVIGHTHGVMDRKGALENTFNNGFTDMLRQDFGTDVAISPGFRMGGTVAGTGMTYENGAVADGAVTIEDAYQFFPMFYGITTANVTGENLFQILEKQLAAAFSSEPFNHRGGWMMGYSGLEIELDLAGGDGNRLRSVKYSDNGQTVMPEDVLSVTGCRRMPIDYPGKLCAVDGFTDIEPVYFNPLKGIPWTAVDTFIKMMSEKTFDGSRQSIVDTSMTALWPGADLLQPLEGVGPGKPADDLKSCGFFKVGCQNGRGADSQNGFGGMNQFMNPGSFGQTGNTTPVTPVVPEVQAAPAAPATSDTQTFSNMFNRFGFGG